MVDEEGACWMRRWHAGGGCDMLEEEVAWWMRRWQGG